MTDYQSFIAAIAANPQEDTPRLVFADWLEENGEAARAGFIRDQVRLAHVRPGTEEYQQLFRRTAATLKANLPAWIQGACDAFGQEAAWRPVASRSRWLHLEIAKDHGRVHSIIPTVIDEAIFERGFLKSARLWILSIREPNTIPKLFAEYPITRLDLRVRRLPIEKWSLVVDDSLKQIQSLAVRGTLSEGDITRMFSSPVWSNLKALELAPTSETLKEFCRLPIAKQLHRFRLPMAPELLRELRDFPVDDRLQDFALTSIEEDYNDVQHPWSELSTISFRPTLKKLVLASLNMQDSGLATFARGEVWLRLRSLVLDNNNIGDRGWRDFVRGRRTPELRMLSAAHNVIGSDGATRLAQSPLVEKLEYIDLRHNRIGGKGALSLARALVESPLKKLLLTGNPINKIDAAMIRKILGSRVD
jgi:uncharacterized protein (TIGR02996 family)